MGCPPLSMISWSTWLISLMSSLSFLHNECYNRGRLVFTFLNHFWFGRAPEWSSFCYHMHSTKSCLSMLEAGLRSRVLSISWFSLLDPNLARTLSPIFWMSLLGVSPSFRIPLSSVLTASPCLSLSVGIASCYPQQAFGVHSLPLKSWEGGFRVWKTLAWYHQASLCYQLWLLCTEASSRTHLWRRYHQGLDQSYWIAWYH